MVIRTGLSVPVFNVLRYLFLIVFIETIARSALNNIRVFLRKFDLYRGKGSAVAWHQIDRYNLFYYGGQRAYVRMIFWTLLVICFYTLEIMFEFSSDAVGRLTGHPVRMLVYNASWSSCQPVGLLQSGGGRRMAAVAQSCVDMTEKGYILYKPVWIKREEGSPLTTLCPKTPENVLRRGERIYKDSQFRKGTTSWNAVTDLISALKADAWTTSQNRSTDLVVISVSSSDIFASDQLPSQGRRYQGGVLFVRIPSRPGALCGGGIEGARGEGMMSVTILACIDNSTSGLHYLQVFGTATVFLDVERMQKELWIVDVPVFFGIALRNFTEDIFDQEDDRGFFRSIAYAGLLSVAVERDSDSLNKYAVFEKKIVTCSESLQIEMNDSGGKWTMPSQKKRLPLFFSNGD